MSPRTLSRCTPWSRFGLGFFFFLKTAFLCFLEPSNLLANTFNCDCRLAWLGDWLRSRKIVTGNPRCQRPGFLKEIPLQDVALPDFRCEEGRPRRAAARRDAVQPLARASARRRALKSGRGSPASNEAICSF